MEPVELVRWAAAILTIAAALMVAWGFVLFTAAAILWITASFLDDTWAILAQNVVLLAVNLWGVLRWWKRI